MKQKTYVLNTLLAVLVGLVCLACMLVRTFAPAVILPEASVPNLVLLSLAALLADHLLAPGAKRCYVCIPVFSALTFGLLPLAAGLVAGLAAVKLALLGGVVFTAAAWLYSSILDRLSSGPAARAAALISALGVYLASQCFAGMF